MQPTLNVMNRKEGNCIRGLPAEDSSVTCLPWLFNLKLHTLTISSAKIILQKLYREAYRRISSVFDFFLLTIHMPCRPIVRSLPGPALKIVFVGDGIMPRISRMAKWIKRDGKYSTVLIANKTGYV